MVSVDGIVTLTVLAGRADPLGENVRHREPVAPEVVVGTRLLMIIDVCGGVHGLDFSFSQGIELAGQWAKRFAVETMVMRYERPLCVYSHASCCLGPSVYRSIPLRSGNGPGPVDHMRHGPSRDQMDF
jgi:hypothetical protein